MNVNMIMQFGEFFTPYTKCTTDSYNSKYSFFNSSTGSRNPKVSNLHVHIMYIVETRGLDYKK